MRILILRLGVVSFLCWTLTACDSSWPPRKDDMIEHFHEHRAGIEVLEAEFAKTNYLRMLIGIKGQAHADILVEEYIRTERLEGDIGNKWHQLFLNAGVNSVYRGDDYVDFEIYVDYGDGIGGITRFVHAPGQEPSLKECKDEFSDLGCGWCAVSLDSDWYISAGWFDYEPDEKALKDLDDDKISWDEYEKLHDIASDACEARGREVIGYPPLNTRPRVTEPPE